MAFSAYQSFTNKAPYDGIVMWLNKDPIGEEGGINLYAYCHNSPVSYVDSQGLEPVTGAVIGIGTTVGTGSSGGAGVTVTVGGGAAAVGTGSAVVVGAVVVAGVATTGLVVYDVYKLNQIHQLNKQNQEAEKCYNQKRNDYEDYKEKCKDIDPPPGLTPCEQARWQLQRKLACKKAREDFTKKYFGGNYDWGHERYMDILNSEIGALEDWIKKHCL